MNWQKENSKVLTKPKRGGNDKTRSAQKKIVKRGTLVRGQKCEQEWGVTRCGINVHHGEKPAGSRGEKHGGNRFGFAERIREKRTRQMSRHGKKKKRGGIATHIKTRNTKKKKKTVSERKTLSPRKVNHILENNSAKKIASIGWTAVY